MDHHLRILIVEDDVLIAEHLMLLISKNFNCNVEQAYSKEQALQKLNQHIPDIVLLDIRLAANIEGIELANMINHQFHIPFIYITGFSDDTILAKAMETNPQAFITKPFKEADVKAAIYLTINSIHLKEPNYLVLTLNNKKELISKQDILYAASDDSYIHIFTSTKKYVQRNSLEWFMQQMSDYHFFRIHRSHVINIKAIDFIKGEAVHINNTILPISRKHKKELMDRLTKL